VRGSISMTVGELRLPLPTTGGVIPACVEFPQAAVAEFIPDFDHQMTALVDPEDVLADQNKGNNRLDGGWYMRRAGGRLRKAARFSGDPVHIAHS
jgi:hypothetical protein